MKRPEIRTQGPWECRGPALYDRLRYPERFRSKAFTPKNSRCVSFPSPPQKYDILSPGHNLHAKVRE